MIRSRVLWLGLLGFALLAVDATQGFADIPSPYPRPPRPFPYGPGFLDPLPAPDPQPPAPIPAPNPQPPQMIDPKTGEATVPPGNRPRRAGPFRSCGSGLGLGLAGIGLAWGMLWVGNRFVRASRLPSARG